MDTAMIWAQDRDRVIGDGAGMLWHVPEDWDHFKRATLGGTVIMGRGTWDAMDGPLPGRRSIVVTRRPGSVVGAETAESVPGAIELGRSGRTGDAGLWVMGGGQIYAQALPFADRCVVSEIDALAAVDPELAVRAPDLTGQQGWERAEIGPWQDSAGSVAGHDGGVRWRVVTWLRRR